MDTTPTAWYHSLWRHKTTHPQGWMRAHVSWPKKLLYAFHPFLIPQLLEMMRQKRLTVNLKASDHHSVPWDAKMTQMLAAQPWTIPQFWWALSQETVSEGVLPLLGQPLQALCSRGQLRTCGKVVLVSAEQLCCEFLFLINTFNNELLGNLVYLFMD